MAQPHRSPETSNPKPIHTRGFAVVADPNPGRLKLQPGFRTAAKRHSADAIALAILFVLMVVAARNGATLWYVPQAARKVDAAADAADTDLAREEQARIDKEQKQRLIVAQLRTDVGNVIGEVSESRWSIASLQKAGPALDSLVAKAKVAGRDDLAIYWRALAEHYECGRAAYGNDRTTAQAKWSQAAKHLRVLGNGATQADGILRGDVISTIGTFLGTARAIGLPAQTPLVAELTRLRNRLKNEDAAAQQAASKLN